MGSSAPKRLGFFERLGAWLGLWTPPRGVEVPPVPWRGIGIGTAVLVVLLGGAAAVALPRIAEDREADRQRAQREEEQRHAAFLEYVDREQAPRRGRGSPARTEPGRGALLAAAKAGIVRDAGRRRDERILGAECEPFPRSTRRLDPVADLSRPVAAYSCVAVTSRFGSEDQAGGRGIIGVQFRLVVDFRRGTYAWCRIIPLGDRDRLSHPLPDACRVNPASQ